MSMFSLLLACAALTSNAGVLSVPSPQTGALKLQQEEQLQQQQQHQQHRDEPELNLGDEVTRETFLQLLRDTPFRLGPGMQRYALDTYEVMTRESRGNVVFSPFSLHTALSMIYFGSPSHSSTHREMAALLGMQDEEHQNDYAVNYLQLLRRYDSLRRMLDTTVEFGNRIFLARGFTPNTDYRLLMQTYYLTDLTAVDFAQSERAAAEINAWVAEKTHGFIRNLISPSHLSSLTRMVIVNAIYFKANWKYQFDSSKTRTLPFRVEPGLPPSEHRAMEQTGQFYVGELPELRARVLELPYEDEDFVMLVFLPDDEGEDAIQRLDAALPSLDLARLERRMALDKYKVRMPKFNARLSSDMEETLRQLGAGSIFDDADLSDIADPRDAGGSLHVSDVIHQAAVEVSEEGTEAAAATAIGVGIRTVRPLRSGEFIVDRPFAFVIKDRRLGVPLFMGRIVDPTGRQRLGRARVRSVQASSLIDERQGDVNGFRQQQQQQQQQFSDADDLSDSSSDGDDSDLPDCPPDGEGYQSVPDPGISFPCRGRETMVIEAAESEREAILQRRRGRASALSSSFHQKR